ncbi:MAG: hypothetical protein L0L12_04320, partial [Corynebacterium casei]
MQKLYTLSVLLMSSFSLGLLYATVKMMMDSDPRASAPLVVFLIAAPVTVFLYFGGKLLGKQINLGIIFGSNLQMFAICAACLTGSSVLECIDFVGELSGVDEASKDVVG